MIARFLYCLSIANLIYLPTWREIFTFSGTVFDPDVAKAHFYVISDDAHLYYFAGTLVVLGLAALFFLIAWAWLRWFPNDVATARNAVLAVLAAYALLYLGTRAPIFAVISRHMPIAIGAGLIGLGLAAWWWRRILALTDLSVKILIPLAAVTLANSVALGVHLAPADGSMFTQEKPLAAPQSGAPTGPRIVLMVFDALDFHIAFEKRPVDVAMPVTDRLVARAFMGSNSFQAGTGTERAVPSMTTGRVVRFGRMSPKDEIFIRYAGTDSYVPWSKQETVFSDLHAKGYDEAALSQLYFQYCRLFHALMRRCWELDNWWQGGRDTVWGRLIDFLVSPVRALPLSGDARPTFVFYTNIPYEPFFTRFLAAAETAAADPLNDFVYIHWMLPHRPFNFDRRSDTFLEREKGPEGYLDNLVLLDRSLGRVVDKLGEVDPGLRNTAVVVTADHHWARSEQIGFRHRYKVPFIVLLPGQAEPWTYEGRFNATVLRAVVSAIADKRIEGYDHLADFITKWVKEGDRADDPRDQPITRAKK